MKNSEIIDKLKNQDSKTQADVIKKYNSRIFLYFRLRIKGEDNYEDLVQEVFASLFQNVQKDKIFEDKFIGPFIFGIAKRVLFNYFYKKKKQESIKNRAGNEFEISYDFVEADRIENETMVGLINKIIEKLPNIDKIIVKEFYLKEKDVGEVALQLGKSKHYISVRKLRALNKIKCEISKQKHIYKI